MEKVSQQTYAASFLKFLNSRRHDFVQELQLEINRGTPRYYIFRKEERTLNFHKIRFKILRGKSQKKRTRETITKYLIIAGT